MIQKIPRVVVAKRPPFFVALRGRIKRARVGAIVGLAQAQPGNPPPGEPAAHPAKGGVRRLFGQHLPARNGCDMFAMDHDWDRHVEKPRMAGVKLGFAIGGSPRVVPAVAALAAPQPLLRAPDDRAERVALVMGNAGEDDADIRCIQCHRQAGEPFEEEGELGKLR